RGRLQRPVDAAGGAPPVRAGARTRRPDERGLTRAQAKAPAAGWNAAQEGQRGDRQSRATQAGAALRELRDAHQGDDLRRPRPGRRDREVGPRKAPPSGGAYSHSMVAGGSDEMSEARRLSPATSLM